jgi:hypothetical protein
MRRNKKGNGAVNRANPDFGRAGIKVQGALFVDFGKRIGRRRNLHTDFRSAGEDLRIFGNLWPIGSEPSHVDSLDAISGRHRALRQGSTPRQKLIQKMDNVTLATRVSECWRRAHKDVAMTIGLNPIRELRKGWIRQNFGPTLEVELGLRIALRHLKGDRHGRRYARKRKNEVQDRRAAAGRSKVSAASKARCDHRRGAQDLKRHDACWTNVDNKQRITEARPVRESANTFFLSLHRQVFGQAPR